MEGKKYNAKLFLEALTKLSQEYDVVIGGEQLPKLYSLDRSGAALATVAWEQSSYTATPLQCHEGDCAGSKDGLHCVHWDDAGPCCRCGEPACSFCDDNGCIN